MMIVSLGSDLRDQMSKIGIGVGEEFPVDDAKTPPPPPPEESEGDDGQRRYWRRHHWLHILTRVALIAFVIAAIVWMFTPHYFFPGPYAGVPPYRFYPYPHFFFFPFFPILLVAFFAFAWRRRGCYRHHHHHDSRDEPS